MSEKWTKEEQEAMRAIGAPPLEFNRIGAGGTQATSGAQREDKGSRPPLTAPAPLPGEKQERIWECKIGGLTGALPPGSDAPMRNAIQEAFYQLAGADAQFCFSGWGGKLDEAERAVVENRAPSAEYEAQWLREHCAQASPAPQQRELSDERIDELCKPWVGLGGIENQYAFARAIEREVAKAAPAAPVQTAEPDQLTDEAIDEVFNAMPGGVDGWLKQFGYRQFARSIARHTLVRVAASMAGTIRPTDDELWEQTIGERDCYHEWADKLANAIAKHFSAEIGEHSNMNCPWAEALEVIEAAPVQAEQAQVEPVKQYIGGRMVRFVVAPAGAKVTFGPDENTVHVDFAAPALPAQAEQAAAVRAAYDKLLAAAQGAVNEAMEAAEEGIHPCDVNNDEAKARRMPAPLRALYYAIKSLATKEAAAVEAPSLVLKPTYRLASALNAMRWALNKTMEGDTPGMRASTLLDKHRSKAGNTVRMELEYLWEQFAPIRDDLTNALLHGGSADHAAKQIAQGDTGGDHE